jgi:hypothetical protein
MHTNYTFWSQFCSSWRTTGSTVVKFCLYCGCYTKQVFTLRPDSTVDTLSTAMDPLPLPSPLSSLRCRSRSLQTSWISGNISFNFPDVNPRVSLDLTSFHLENTKFVYLRKTAISESNGTKLPITQPSNEHNFRLFYCVL